MSRLGPLKVFAAVILLFAGISFLGYYSLGGLNPLVLQTVEVQNYKLAGRYFHGSYKSDTVERYFKEMKSYVDEGAINGRPAIIYDQEPDGSRGISKMFIGVSLESQTIPQGIPNNGLESRQITALKCIRVSKDSHISVMPSSLKINRKIQDYAASKGLKVSELSIEIYYPDDRLVIERPIQPQFH